jgi:hypothetical protein
MTAGVTGPRGTVPASYVRALLDFAVERGASRQNLLAASGLVGAPLSDDDHRMPLDACVRLMAASVKASGDPAFALEFGERVRTEALGLPFLIAGVAGTVEEARLEFNRYNALIGEDGSGSVGADALGVVKDRRGVWLEFRPSAYMAHVWLVEVAVVWCVRETRRMLALHHASRPFPRAIHFVHDEPSYRDEYVRILAAPLVFGSDRNALLVDDSFLTLAMPGASPYVSRGENEDGEGARRERPPPRVAVRQSDARVRGPRTRPEPSGARPQAEGRGNDLRAGPRRLAS